MLGRVFCFRSNILRTPLSSTDADSVHLVNSMGVRVYLGDTPILSDIFFRNPFGLRTQFCTCRLQYSSRKQFGTERQYCNSFLQRNRERYARTQDYAVAKSPTPKRSPCDPKGQFSFCFLLPGSQPGTLHGLQESAARSASAVNGIG